MEYEKRIENAKYRINNSDCIIIGGGAGLSDSAGIHYSGKRFTDNFKEFIAKYGMEDMYSSSFYPFKTEEEKWGYWAKHIYINRYEVCETKLYLDLFELVKNKEYFIITTNVDYQFYKAGFDHKRIFAVQGDYGYLQCAKGCHNKLYYNEEIIKEMIEKTVYCKIPNALIPKCPVCGGKMDINIRKDQYFVQDMAWYEANNKYNDFLNKSNDKNVVFFELGVGYNTPGIIRFPFERMTSRNKNSVLIRINKYNFEGEKENIKQSIIFDEDVAEVIKHLL